MKSLVLLGALFSASLAHAQFTAFSTVEEAFKAVPVCEGAVTVDETRVARVSSPGQVTVNGVGEFEAFDLAVPRNVVDLKIKGDTLYVLTPTKIQEWNLTSRVMTSEAKTATDGAGLGYREGAHGMDWQGDKLVIAHGLLGFAIYDTVSHRITAREAVLQDILPHLSVLVDVRVMGDRALFVADNHTLQGDHGPKPFRGFVVVDLATLKQVRRVSGIDPGAETIEVTGDTVMVGHDGPIQSFLLSEIASRGNVSLHRTVYKFPKAGHPFGQAAVAGDKLLTCFMEDQAPGAPKKFVPMALDLSLFRL